MNPQDFLDKVKDACNTGIEREMFSDEKNIQKIAMKVQGKVLGFTVNDNWGTVESVSDEFAAELMEDSQKELEILKRKIRKSAQHKLKSIKDLRIPELAMHQFNHEIEQTIKEERDKVLPLIRKIIKAEVHKEMIEPWLLVAKMRGIDIDEGIPF